MDDDDDDDDSDDGGGTDDDGGGGGYGKGTTKICKRKARSLLLCVMCVDKPEAMKLKAQRPRARARAG